MHYQLNLIYNFLTVCALCIVGYHGAGINCAGPSGTDDRPCEHCVEGYYGGKCDLSCPADCYGQCHRETGNCTHGCKTEGLCGTHCQNQCPSNCRGALCTFHNCKCREDCAQGYYGSRCDRSCPLQCYGQCHRETGNCTNGCKKGGLCGNQCQNQCPNNCRNDACFYETCECVQRCKAGYSGHKCEQHDASFGTRVTCDACIWMLVIFCLLKLVL